jgi:glycosyltransferase involved in cell wall biosynthesis
MKILIFNWRDLKHSWAGGGEIYVFELAKRWVKMGHEVTVFCGQDPYQKLADEEEYQGIKIIRKGGTFSLYFWAPIYYFKKLRKNVDIIIDVQNGIPFFTPLFSRIPKIAFVYHVHKNQFFYQLHFPVSYIGYFIEQYVFPIIYRGVQVVAISETTKEELVSIGFKAKNIKVVYCGIDKPNSKRKGLIKKFSVPTLLYLGRIKGYKRVDLLVDIFKDILRDLPSARLIIAGWGTEASGLTDIVMRSSVRRRVDILGPVTNAEKIELLSRAWLFVNLSIGEGWSMAVIESNMHGTPAVAFNVPGLSESIRHGYTGLLAKDREDIIKKILKIITNEEYRERISKNAKKWAESFSWEKAAEESLGVMQKLVNK